MKFLFQPGYRNFFGRDADAMRFWPLLIPLPGPRARNEDEEEDENDACGNEAMAADGSDGAPEPRRLIPGEIAKQISKVAL